MICGVNRKFVSRTCLPPPLLWKNNSYEKIVRMANFAYIILCSLHPDFVSGFAFLPSAQTAWRKPQNQSGTQKHNYLFIFEGKRFLFFSFLFLFARRDEKRPLLTLVWPALSKEEGDWMYVMLCAHCFLFPANGNQKRQCTENKLSGAINRSSVSPPLCTLICALSAWCFQRRERNVIFFPGKSRLRGVKGGGASIRGKLKLTVRGKGKFFNVWTNLYLCCTWKS